MHRLLLTAVLFAVFTSHLFAQAVATLRAGDIFDMRLGGMPVEYAQEFSLQYTDMKDYSHLLTNYPDFPAPGVLFRDMSPLLFDVEARSEILESFRVFIQDKNIDAIA